MRFSGCYRREHTRRVFLTHYDPIERDARDCPTGDNVTVTINGLQHSWAGDVIATLTNVSTGVSGDLFNRIGRTTNDPNDFGSGAMFGIDLSGMDTYSFNSSFTGDIWADAASQGTANSIDSGNYWTTTAFSGTKTNFSSMYNGQLAAGDWRLTLSDNFGPDGDGGGSFIDWTVTLNLTDVPEPSFAIPTGLLLVGLVLIGRARYSDAHAPGSPLLDGGGSAASRGRDFGQTQHRFHPDGRSALG